MAADLVLAMHGTRSVAGQAVAADLASAVAAELPGVSVHLGWADVLTPTLTETLAGLADRVRNRPHSGPAREVDRIGDGSQYGPAGVVDRVRNRPRCGPVVVPCFLTAGYHVTSDLPAAIQASGGRARLAGLIGPGLVAAVADRLAEAGGPGDAVVLAAAGSRRRRALAEVAAAAESLSRLVGRPVVPAFLTAAEPSVPDAVAALRAAGHDRVAVASYLLAPGVFADRLADVGADLVSAPIGVHPLVVHAVRSAYADVVAHDLDLTDALVTASGVERIA